MQKAERPMFSRRDLDNLFGPPGQNGHMGHDRAVARYVRYEKKNRGYIKVRRQGGGAREQARIRARIDKGIVRPGYQGEVLRARFEG